MRSGLGLLNHADAGDLMPMAGAAITMVAATLRTSMTVLPERIRE